MNESSNPGFIPNDELEMNLTFIVAIANLLAFRCQATVLVVKVVDILMQWIVYGGRNFEHSKLDF
jgi:hypothetical protein